MSKTLLTDDEVLYILMSFGTLYNADKIFNLEKLDKKAFRKSKAEIKKRMTLFALRYRNQAEKVMKRYQSMSDVERSTFYLTFDISENLKKEFNI